MSAAVLPFAPPTAVTQGDALVAPSAVARSQAAIPLRAGPPESEHDPHRLARRFLEAHADDRGQKTLAFWEGQFFEWRDGVYRQIKHDDLRARLTSFVKCEFDRRIVVDSGGLVRIVTTALVTSVFQALAGFARVEADSLPSWIGAAQGEERFIAFRNGLLPVSQALEDDALPGTIQASLRATTPEWFSTTQIPYDFDATAKCERWLSFLERVMERDEQRIRLLQEFAGYLLTPDNSQHKFLIFAGEGANGKSVSLQIFIDMLGAGNVSHVPLEQFGSRFGLTPTLGKAANICAEVGEIDRIAEGTLKQFTAGDRMTFDRKGISAIEAYPTARLILSTNNRPKFADRSDGLWRRMLLVPFRVTIASDEQDRQLVGKLREELPGIVNWALAGLRRLRKQGHFTLPAVVSAALDEYRAETNFTRGYLQDAYEADADGIVPIAALYTGYKAWCEANGHRPLVGTAILKELRNAFPGAPLDNRKKVSTPDGRRALAYTGISASD